MAEPTSEQHYEEEFEFPLWKLIKERAKKKDISYMAALNEVLPEYVRTIRFRDSEFEKAAIEEGLKRLDALAKRERIDLRF